MTGHLSRIAIAGLPLLLAAPLPAPAAPTQPVDDTREICLDETQAAEQAMGIPQHLLSAIALAETGRWDADSRASFAWPWTVMAEGRGRYFPTKREAVAEVRRLTARGITNIDVGCMQINLRHHGDAFASLEQALDPATNVAYAGEFLKTLFASTGSWTQAAAHYHSATPDLGAAYKQKVVDLWNRSRRAAAAGPAAGRSAPAPAGEVAPAPRAQVSIDMARTARLNARLRATRADERAIDFATRRQEDLAAWRESQAAALPTRHAALMRRAQAAAERSRELLAPLQERAETFAERRHDQLRRWRLSHAGRDDAS